MEEAPGVYADKHSQHSSQSQEENEVVFHRRNVLIGRASAQPPAWTGCHGSRDLPHVCESSNSTVFAQMLWDMHEDLCAYMFLFMEVNCLSHCAASCRRLRTCLWSDRAFWQTYIGPCIASSPSFSLQAGSLRESFRKWLFHLDGTWTHDFREFVEESKRSAFGADFVLLLSDARYIASGLMPHDSRNAISDFAGLLCELLAEYNSSQLDERREAESLVAQVERRSDVFLEMEVRDITMALDRSIEHAILDQPPDDAELEPDRLLDPLEDASDEERFPEREDWPNLDFAPSAAELEMQTPDMHEVHSSGGNVESFWRDPDDDIDLVMA